MNEGVTNSLAGAITFNETVITTTEKSYPFKQKENVEKMLYTLSVC